MIWSKFCVGPHMTPRTVWKLRITKKNVFKILDFRKTLKIYEKIVNPQKNYHCFIDEKMLKNVQQSKVELEEDALIQLSIFIFR